jgi:hypothetical protein
MGTTAELVSCGSAPPSAAAMAGMASDKTSRLEIPAKIVMSGFCFISPLLLEPQWFQAENLALFHFGCSRDFQIARPRNLKIAVTVLLKMPDSL